MESDNESYYEGSSEAEEEAVEPLQIQGNINDSPESPPPGSPSPVPPQQLPVEEPSPGWELPDDGINFLNCFPRQVVVDFKKWALETRERRNEEGYVVEAPVISQNLLGYLFENYGPQWEIEFLRPSAGPILE